MTWEISLISSSSIIFQMRWLMFFAQRQHDDGGALGAGERPDIFFDGGFCGFGPWSLYRLMQPGADDRQRFFGMRLDHFADFLMEDLRTCPSMRRDIDHALRGRRQVLWLGAPSEPARLARRARQVPATGDVLAMPGRRAWPLTGREHAGDQRTRHEQADQQRGDEHDRGFDDLEPVRRRPGPAAASAPACHRACIDAGEFHVGDLHLVAACWRRSPSPISPGGDLRHFLGRARLVGGLARRIRVGIAVHHHGDRQLFDVAAIHACWL